MLDKIGVRKYVRMFYKCTYYLGSHWTHKWKHLFPLSLSKKVKWLSAAVTTVLCYCLRFVSFVETERQDRKDFMIDIFGVFALKLFFKILWSYCYLKPCNYDKTNIFPCLNSIVSLCLVNWSVFFFFETWKKIDKKFSLGKMFLIRTWRWSADK